MKRKAVLFAAAAVCAAGFLCPVAAGAADPVDMLGDLTSPVELTADRLSYDRDTGWAHGVSNVVARKKGVELRADAVSVNMKTGRAYARGNVELHQDGRVFRFEQAEYDFEREEIVVRKITGETEPFRVLGVERLERKQSNVYVLHDATVTTCALDSPGTHYKVHARSVEVRPDDVVLIRGATWRFGRVPVMYLPYWRRKLGEDSGFRIYPGHDSRMGAFVLGSYRYRINPELGAETHLDYRYKRGVAVGQDLAWERPNKWFGDFTVYYADDQEPLDEDDDPVTSGIDNDRYRVRFAHRTTAGRRGSLSVRAHYLSDTDILEDFFDHEYRREKQPDNFAAYTYQADTYTATLLARGRLNDFYESVNRFPEATVAMMQRELGDTALFYEGAASVSFLERVWDERYEGPDAYSSFRLDTANLLRRPSKHFGFLNVTPRLGYRGTYYSSTRATQTSFETSQVTQTNLVDSGGGMMVPVTVVSTETNSIVRELDDGAGLRNLFEVGVEVSFKAFKSWQGGVISPLRHIVEPYLDYSIVPEPNLEPDDLYQFDRVDRLDQTHALTLGIRNKLQTKNREGSVSLLDADLYTHLQFERDEGEDLIESLFLAMRMRPSEQFDLRMDATFGIDQSRFERVDTRLDFLANEIFGGELRHLYVADESNLLLGELSLTASRKWEFDIFGRYEFEQSRVEEQGLRVIRTFDCMRWSLGGSVLPEYTLSDGSLHEAEWRVMLEFVLTAFPSLGFGVDHGERM